MNSKGGKMKYRYIMVTHWANHWDRLTGNQTYYTFRTLKNDISFLKETWKGGQPVPTIFIKLNENTKVPERAWEGYTSDFKIDSKRKRIYFRVKIEKEVQVPFKYRNLREGWYTEKFEEVVSESAILFPPFFYIMRKTSSWDEFEEYVYYLFKLLGIHNIYKYEKQRGAPDGFFKFGNLAVVYDATLERDFEESKRDQINNYCNLLKSGRIQYQTITVDVSNCRKQVWIITRGLSSRIIREQDEVTVKEVPIDELIKIYQKRIEDNLKEVELEDELKNI